ncbi:hypothetical protein D3C77_669340 [compost metagenome]
MSDVLAAGAVHGATQGFAAQAVADIALEEQVKGFVAHTGGVQGEADQHADGDVFGDVRITWRALDIGNRYLKCQGSWSGLVDQAITRSSQLFFQLGSKVQAKFVCSARELGKARIATVE